MKTLMCAQGSSEWFTARCGVVTASEVDSLVSPTGEIRKGKGVRTYLCQKVAEKVMGYSEGSLSSWDMEQGKILETIAIPWLAFERDLKIDRVGLCIRDDPRCACSPDGLIGDDCGLEIKSPQPKTQVQYLLDGRVPDQYIAQVQMSMYVTKRPRWLFVSYSRDLPKLVLTVEPDPAFQAALDTALKQFLADFDAAHLRIQQLIQPVLP